MLINKRKSKQKGEKKLKYSKGSFIYILPDYWYADSADISPLYMYFFKKSSLLNFFEIC